MAHKKITLLLLTASLLASLLSACASQNKLMMMPFDRMPEKVQSAPTRVLQAYQFAAANPDTVKEIPCYCGCNTIGHTSNYDCYVADVDASGYITFDEHAVSCSICVDITQDVMRMVRDGKSPQEARAYIDMSYSKYGTSTTP